MRWTGVNRAEAAPVGRIVGIKKLEFITAFVIEQDRTERTVNLEGQEIVATVSVACSLERTNRAILETQQCRNLIVHINRFAWHTLELARRAKFVLPALLHGTLLDVGLQDGIHARDFTNQVPRNVDHVRTDVAKRTRTRNLFLESP